ncbi:hypothetical protein ACFQRC_07280 [Enterovirga sp. GCM10030262]|uniref:hypothetical protein n=1 Tax=Enterovirga sp. GCM10030262 TaxID=3273391 RepID=UPI003614B87A
MSEEDRKRGKEAGDVVMYRYAGFWDGEFHLEGLNDNGDITSVNTCSQPCIALKSYYGGRMIRTAYNPASVVGAAMEDAMKGRLVRKKPERKRPEPSVDTDGSQAEMIAEVAPAAEEDGVQSNLAAADNLH